MGARHWTQGPIWALSSSLLRSFKEKPQPSGIPTLQSHSIPLPMLSESGPFHCPQRRRMAYSGLKRPFHKAGNAAVWREARKLNGRTTGTSLPDHESLLTYHRSHQHWTANLHSAELF